VTAVTLPCNNEYSINSHQLCSCIQEKLQTEKPKENRAKPLSMGVNSNRVEHFDNREGTLRIQTQTPSLEIHAVQLPPQRTTFYKLRQRVSEIFFPDDPLYRFKNQTSFKRFILALQYLFPIFQWAPNYNLTLLRSDLISGLTIASLAIPQVPQKFLLFRHQIQFFFIKPLIYFLG